jgi:hypothetical protein
MESVSGNVMLTTGYLLILHSNNIASNTDKQLHAVALMTISKMQLQNEQLETWLSLQEPCYYMPRQGGQVQFISVLWPYELRIVVYFHITVPVLLDGQSQLELFSGVKMGFRMRDNHAFLCPIIALQNSLAAGDTISNCLL